MKWSFRIATFGGTEVRVHVTFLLLLAFYGFLFHNMGGVPAMVQGLVFILLLFLCVLLHEFGHALAARAYGIRTPDITLLPIGGLARLERMPEKPSQELVVALAGPAVNVAIALGLALVIGPDLLRIDPADLGRIEGNLVLSLLSVNIFLVLFNLLPAFPMDGGRVLRALLATKLSYARATEIAATVGQAMALIFGFVGFFQGMPMLILIAFFVWMGASQEVAFTNMRSASSGLPVETAMVRDFTTLDDRDTLNEAVEALLRTSQQEFPIIPFGGGSVLGILTRHDLIRALRATGASTPVVDVMRRNIPTVQMHSPFDDAFRIMRECDCPALPVVDSYGRLVGLITPENVGELMMVHSAVGGGTGTWRRIRGLGPGMNPQLPPML